MRSQLECFRMADQCEDMALIIAGKANRQILRDIAEHWRALADAAKAAESGKHALPQST
jgi:hypothetical protein